MSKIVNVKECPIGSIILEDVYKENSTIPLIVRDTIFTEKIKNKLLNNNKFEILIKEINKEKIEVVPQITENKKFKFSEFEESYRIHLDMIEIIFNNTINNIKVDLDVLTFISFYYLDNLSELSTMIKYIQQDFKDKNFIFKHSINVGIYSLFIGNLLGLPKNMLKNLLISSLLHDIGMIKINSDIVNIKEVFDNAEFEKVKKHSTFSYSICKKFNNINKEVLSTILYHHKRCDGSGYPDKLKKEDIPFTSKIIAIADEYDILINKKIKDSSSPFDIFQDILNLAYSKKLDLELSTRFIRYISEFYVGSKVEFKDGEIGYIEFIPPRDIRYPLLRVDGEIVDTLVQEKYRFFKFL